MGGFTILLDAPATPVARMQLAEIGDGFKDPRYGEFAITEDEVQEWAKNLAALPGGRALIDEDHLSDKPSPHRRTEASGWITNVELDGNKVMGDVHWTPKGQSAIEEERYLFFSPAFGKHANEKGETFENTLTGGALTNKPFLTQMPMITLASAPRLLEAAREASATGDGDGVMTLDQAFEQGITVLDISQDMREKHAVVTKNINGKKVHMFPIPPGDKNHARAALSLLPAAIKAGHINSSEAAEVRARANSVLGRKEMSDSRSQMNFTDDSLTALGITDEDVRKKLLDEANADGADFTQIFQKVTLAAGTGKPADSKTLEEQAAANGKIVLDSGQFTQIMADAAKGKAGGEGAPKQFEVTPDMLTTLGITDEGAQKKILDLADESDSDVMKLLGAIVATKTAAPPEAGSGDSKTLDELAKEEGKVLLDGPQVAQLMADARSGADAKRELEQQGFDIAFERNVTNGKVVPAQKEQMQSFYTLDKEGTIKLMDEAPAKLNTKPKGRNVLAPNENMPEGVYQEGFELDGQVQTYMREHDEKDYVKALEAVTGISVGSAA